MANPLRVSRGVQQRQRVLSARQLLIEAGLSIVENFLLDPSNSLMNISWPVQVVHLTWIDRCLLDPALHACARQVSL